MAQRRSDERALRVSAGLDELDQWLCDQIRTGLAGLDRAGYQQIDSIAARMVDAQAPGVAGRLRRLSAVLASGEGWHARLLEHFALLRLLVRAHRRLGELPVADQANYQELIGGGDPLPFGLAANHPTIEALIQYAYSQKIIPARVRPEEVFASNALDL